MKINHKYHIRRRGKGKGKVRKNPGVRWSIYKIKTECIPPKASVIDTLADEFECDQQAIEWLYDQNGWSYYKIKASALPNSNTGSVIDVLASNFGCNPKNIQWVK